MGFWKDFFWDDKPCLWISRVSITDDEPKVNQKQILQLMQSNEELKRLTDENRELKKKLKNKRANAIDVDYKLLE